MVTFLKEGEMGGESSSDSCGPPVPSNSSSGKSKLSFYTFYSGC